MSAPDAFFPLIRKILGLAWPVLVAQVVSIGMMAADTLIVGHYSTQHLAAVAVGSSLYVTLMLSLGGVVQALVPIIGQHRGANNTGQITLDVQEGLWLSIFLSLLGMALLFFPEPMLRPAHLEPDVEAMVMDYLRLLAFALPASLGYRVFHAVATALNHPRPLIFIALAETCAHAVLAWCLVGGNGGLPAFGSFGAALSQCLVSWGGFLLCFLILTKNAHFSGLRIFSHLKKPSWKGQKELLRLGVPMGFSSLVEISAFTLMAVFVAPLGNEMLGAHRIAANLSALLYMLPLSLSIAIAVQVAQAVGAGRETLAYAFVRAGLLLASSLALTMAFTIFFLKSPIAGLATGDKEVAAIGAGLLAYIAFYQFFDAVQTVACFALRAYKVSFVPFVIHLFCFWGLGLGLGYWLAFLAPKPQGVAGFWQGIVLGTVLAAIFFGVLLKWVTGKRLREEDKLVSPPTAQG